MTNTAKVMVSTVGITQKTNTVKVMVIFVSYEFTLYSFIGISPSRGVARGRSYG